MSYRLQMNLSLAHNSEDQVKENLGEISQRQNSLVQRMTTFHPWTGYIWSPCLKKDQPKKSTHRNTINWERQPTHNCIFCLNYYANYLQIFCKCYLLPKVNWQSRLKNPSSILATIENWESRRKDWGSRIEDWGLKDCQLTFEWYYIFIKFQSTAFLLQKKFTPNNMASIQSKEVYFIISFTFVIFRKTTKSSYLEDMFSHDQHLC